MDVFYKFGSCTGMEILKFDGQHITVADVKRAIFRAKRLGLSGGVDLKIKVAQSKDGKLRFPTLLLSNVYNKHYKN